MYIVVCIVYILYLSQEERAEDMSIRVGTVYISHLSQFHIYHKRREENICTFL